MTSWTDDLATMTELPAVFPGEGAPAAPRIGYHVGRAGFGTWAANYIRTPATDSRYLDFRRWKADPAGQGDFLDTAAAAIVGMIRQWSAVLPHDWLVTAPPQGASEGAIYPAGILAREVAQRLDLDYQTTMQRAKAKRWHHPHESMRQEPFTVAVVPRSVVIVVDDFISSGTTLRLAREALAARGVASFAFCWGSD